MSPVLLQQITRTMSPTSLELQPFPWLSSADVQWLLCVGTLVAVVPVAVVVVLVAVVPVAVVAVMPVPLTEPLAGPGSGAVPAGTGWLPTHPWEPRSPPPQGCLHGGRGFGRASPRRSIPVPRTPPGQGRCWRSPAAAPAAGSELACSSGEAVLCPVPMLAAAAEGKVRVFPQLLLTVFSP